MGLIPRTYSALGLTITSWENLEIVDRLGDAVNLDDLVQDPPTDIDLSSNFVLEEQTGALIGELSVTDPDNDIGEAVAARDKATV